MSAQGKAEVAWKGTLATGNGHAKFGSGTGGNLPVTCVLEDQAPEGKTTPEEFLAAAHATCFSMALCQMLTMNKFKPDHVRVAVTNTLEQADEKSPYLITTESLDVSGKVPGIDKEGFLKMVEAAKPMCAVGQAISGNVKILYNVHLES